MKTQTLLQLRQGDVQLQQVAALPAKRTEIAPAGNRLVLAHGEVTGHAHAIYDYAQSAREIADATIARARLWSAPDGTRYLEVIEPVTLRHEEHTEHAIPPGVYKLPVQVEYTPAELRRVAD